MGKSFWLGSLLVITFLVLLIPLSAFGVDMLTVKDTGGVNTMFRVDDGGTVEVPGGFIWDQINKRLGIGTNTPGQALDVVAPNNGLIQFANTTTDSTAKVARMVVRHYLNSQIPLYIFGAASVASNNYLAFGGGSTAANAATQIDFFTSPTTTTPMGTSRLTVTKDGYIGIGTQAPTHLIQLSGGAYSDGATWVNASSREYKENITELTTLEATDTILKLDPVKYNYKVDREDKHVGFIAEDVPDLVATKDRKGLSPMDIVAVLTKVVQDQQKTIAELKKEMAELKKEVKLKNGFAAVDVK